MNTVGVSYYFKFGGRKMNHIAYNNETVTTFDSCIWEANLSDHSVCFLSSAPEKIFGISQEQFIEKPILAPISPSR